MATEKSNFPWDKKADRDKAKAAAKAAGNKVSEKKVAEKAKD